MRDRGRKYSLLVVFALVAGTVGAVASLPASAAPPVTEVVGVGSIAPNGQWALESAASSTGTYDFVLGPATPPSGVGSLAMSIASGQHEWLNNYAYGVCATGPACDSPGSMTPIANLDALSYSVNRASGTTMPTLNIETYITGVGGYTSLVFIPESSLVSNGTWQAWDGQDPADGVWYSSRNVGSGVFNCGSFACSASWSQIVAAYPNAKVVYGLGPNVGTGGTFLGHVDSFTIGVSGDTTIYDFEPLPGAPTIGSATPGSGDASVSWTAGLDGGAAITGYVVTPYIGAAPQPSQTFNSPVTSQTVTGLTNGTAYTFTVAATNIAGTGPASASSNAVTPLAPPPIPSSCKNSENQSAEMGMYPANPGSQSSLKVSCLFESDVDSPTYMVPSAFTVHDFENVSYHNGAARTVTNSAAVAIGASSIQIGATDGATLATWVNRAITGPGIAGRTFVTSVTAGGQVNLSELTTAAVASGAGTYKIDNAAGARSIDTGTVTGGATSLTTVAGVGTSANFSPADVGLSVTGTQIPAGTTITAVGGPNSATMSNPADGVGVFGAQVVAIGSTLLVTSARMVDDSLYVSPTRVSTIAGRNGASDIGLAIAGPGISPGAIVVGVAGAGNKNLDLGGACLPTCATASPVGPRTVTIGDPSGTATANGDTAVSLALQLDLDPNLFLGIGSCADEEPETLMFPGTFYQPGSFQTPLFGGAIPTGVRVVGQILFDTGVPADFAAYIVHRPALAGGDPNLNGHFDVVLPLLPATVALCDGSAPDLGYDSPGLGLSLTVMGQTASQAALRDDVGRPGTAQLRSVGEGSGGYFSTVFIDSQAGPVLAPAANFNRLCFYPAASEVKFTCGNG